jgi:hypothetical protein
LEILPFYWFSLLPVKPGFSAEVHPNMLPGVRSNGFSWKALLFGSLSPPPVMPGFGAEVHPNMLLGNQSNGFVWKIPLFAA